MEKVMLNAYLFFDGNCREAMVFYQQIFGGELQAQTFGEVDHNCSGAMKDRIMHASLMGGAITLRTSDGPESQPLGTGKISLALGGYDEEKLSQCFEKLSARGEVVEPLRKAPWGDTFGALNDQYGVNWMVNIAAKKPA